MSTPRCKLCTKESDLSRSHIVSEFFYKPIYDENHKFFGYESSDNSFEKTFQKGLREPLLCAECESRLSVCEKYASRIFHGGQKIYTNIRPDRVEIIGLDYPLLKLFQLSILWRMSVSTLSFFRHVDLGPIEEEIRRMILANDPGSEADFPVLYAAPFVEGSLANGFLTPDSVRVDKDRLYRALIGGVLHLFFVRGKSIPTMARKLVLSSAGSMTIIKKDVLNIPFLRDSFLRVATANLGKSLAQH